MDIPSHFELCMSYQNSFVFSRMKLQCFSWSIFEDFCESQFSALKKQQQKTDKKTTKKHTHTKRTVILSLYTYTCYF